MSAFVQDIGKIAQGHWALIHPSLGIPREAMTKAGKPCLMCNGHDRFIYDDKDGRGSYFCRRCGAGDGFTLLMKYHGWDFKKTADEVRRVLGVNPQSTKEKPTKKKPTQKLALDLWAAAKDTTVSHHPYARRKGIRGACGARRGIATGRLVGMTADCILVPSRTLAGAVVGVECINPDGIKQSFGTKSLLILGSDLDPILPCLVVEGWATGCAYLNSRGWKGMAVVSFGKGRLERVAQQIEGAYPYHNVYIAQEQDDG